MTFRESVENVLYSEMDYSRIKRGIDYMAEVYGQATDYKIGSLTNEQMIKTENGHIVSPMHAVHCLNDLMRTTRFLRGIEKAIEHHLSQSKQPIRILYAGCGPYATLLTPFTSIYSADQIQFSMLDYNEFSVALMQKLYTKWQLNSYLEDVIVADATSAEIELTGNYDIIISETMQNALRNECQVPLTRNMVRFLKPKGSFIPERILIDSYLEGEKEGINPCNSEKTQLGRVYDLNFKDVPKVGHQVELDIPATHHKRLYTSTIINVYGDETIEPYESGLTIPHRTNDFDELPKKISYTYLENDMPGFQLEYH